MQWKMRAMNETTRLSGKDYFRIGKSRFRQFTPLRKNYTEARCLVFPEFKIAYVPIPKCANSSIRAALLPLIGIQPESIQKIQEFRGFEERNFKRFLKKENLDNWYVFCVVRNPYSRFASAYLDKLVTRHEVLRPLRRMGLTKGDNFLRYMKMLSMWPIDARNEHFAPQSRMLSKIGHLPELNFHKFENLYNDWEGIRQEIFTRSNILIPKLEHRNKTKTDSNWKNLYCENTKALADQMASEDFHNFGYEMEL